MQKNKTTHVSAGILLILFVAIFLILTGRFMYIQATGEINDISLEDWATKKRTASYSLHAERGKIFDNNGMTLAYDRPTFQLYAIVDETYSANQEEPIHVDDPGKTAKLLAPILGLEENEMKDRIEKGIEDDEVFQIEFGNEGKELSQQTKDEIEDLHLPGINFNKEYIRYYPNAMFASHIIGFAQKKDGGITGVAGIENEMNDLLSGKDGYISYRRDKYGAKLLDPNEVVTKPKDGEDVYLTINQKVQTLLEDTMSQVDEAYNPERMTAVVMNPKTGEVVAMSSRPSYNPNNPTDVGNWYNDVISTPFDPGSTMKMFTWAAAIEEGVYNGEEWYESGDFKANERVDAIRDHNGGKGWGSITFDEGFERSSNVAAAKLAWEKIGPEKYLDYLHAFDFDKKTDIDLPGEVPGTILYRWPIEKITTAFGQGTTLTPIQQMKAATAIANDGKMLKPYVISKTVNSNSGKIIEEHKPEVVGEPISKETASQVLELLDSVVTGEHGTGGSYKLDDYSVIGKTGTSQIPNTDGTTAFLTGRENYIFSFLGMAPKDDPKLMMYVSIKQPELENYETGSVPVSFIFKNVMENSLQYLHIEPDKDAANPVHTIEIPDLVGSDTSAVKKSLSEKGLSVTVIGSGEKILDTNTGENSELFPNDRVILLTDKPTMPNITGWSVRDVMQLADLLQLKVETTGNGYVVSQSIKKGNKLKTNDSLNIELQPPDEGAETEAPKTDGDEQDDTINEADES